jgi:uncharacterized protein (TIGR03086 family)
MQDSTSPTTRQRFDEANCALVSVLDSASGRWDRPSPCEGWTAADVVQHLIDAQRGFLEERALLEPAGNTGTEQDPAAAWRAHVERIAPVLSDVDLMATRFDGYFGPTTIGDTFVQFYVFDMVVHRWDVASAVGGDATLSDDELDLIERSAAGWGDALYMEGICTRLEVPDDADRATRVLGLLGRAAPSGTTA